MPINTIAILSPGDMGHAIGSSLRKHGFDIITCLNGRSDRTRMLAAKANFKNVPNMPDMVSQSDLILSILVPSEAIHVARMVAQAIRTTGASPAFADCNAVSPKSALMMNDIINRVGARFIDGSIIGNPPGHGSSPRLYVSGPNSELVAELDTKGIIVRTMGKDVGQASAIKMCYAAGTKGTFALHTALLAAADVLGVSDELASEMRESQAAVYNRMEIQVPRLPIPAGRWVGEMEEIAATFEQVGIPPDFHRGAAEIFRLLSKTTFAQETPESQNAYRTLPETIRSLVELLPRKVQDKRQELPHSTNEV